MGIALQQLSKISNIEISGTLDVPDTLNVSGVSSFN
jgi:hypothetical protein